MSRGGFNVECDTPFVMFHCPNTPLQHCLIVEGVSHPMLTGEQLS